MCRSLLGCSAQGQLAAPPATLTEPTAAPVAQGRTNGALAKWLLDYQSALEACNADKAAIAVWREKVSK